MKDWNLSDDELFSKDETVSGHFYFRGDVKKFIRRLKQLIREHHYNHSITWHIKEIEKLAGDKLT